MEKNHNDNRKTCGKFQTVTCVPSIRKESRNKTENTLSKKLKKSKNSDN